jgi:hypothetical protein
VAGVAAKDESGKGAKAHNGEEPKRKVGDPPPKTEEWFDDGADYLEKGDVRGAKTCFDGFLIDGMLLMNLGVLQRKRDGLRESKHSFESAELWFSEVCFWSDTFHRWAQGKEEKEEYKEDIDWFKGKLSAGFGAWGRAIAYLARIELRVLGTSATPVTTDPEAERIVDKANNYFAIAVEKYKKATVENGRRTGAIFYDMGVAYYRKFLISENPKDGDSARTCFLKSKIDVLGVLVNLDEDAAGILSDKPLLYGLLDDWRTKESSFFKETIGDVADDEVEKFKDIYVRSIYIISMLKLEGVFETDIVHYTNKEAAQKLLFDDAKFRLSDVDRSGDEEEGKVLMGYLFGDCAEKVDMDRTYGAFTGCFTFGCNSLTHFKFFGNKNTGEGTGLSLVFKREFFGGSDGLDTDLERVEKNIKTEKYGLYRCAYFSPEKKEVVTVGHVEKQFYPGGDMEYTRYMRGIDQKVQNINKKLKELKKNIDKYKLDRNKVEKLLLKLRYLVKDVSYEDEQECRIVQICQLYKDRGRLTRDESYGVFLEYGLRVADHVKQVYFGPNTEEKGNFAGFLKYKGLDIKCDRSRNLVAKKK